MKRTETLRALRRRVRYQCKREAQRPANKSAIRIALTQLIYLLETSDEECITNGISIVAATRKAHEMLARLHDNGTDPAAIERKTRYLFSALRLDK